MDALTLGFSEISASDLPKVGGKGANLGVLTRAGVTVPPGFCVTTAAFRQFITALPGAEARFAELEALDGTSLEKARFAAEGMRGALDQVPMPTAVSDALLKAWRELGTEHPLAVRSSATAEDLPGASFAGQQDTFLNVRGEAALLEAVRRCWISLFSDRAVLYRARGRFGHRAIHIGVVVQRLIDPEAAGILFTADPISGHRHLASIDAGFGLGEALVSGVVSADLYQVDRRTGEVKVARPGDKPFAIRSIPGGGTRREELSPELRHARVLDDAAVRALVAVGDTIERVYGGEPQDIEWCIAGGTTYIVQARPITSLFPVPRSGRSEPGLRVYLGFGHLQMMHDALPRMAMEVWRYFFPPGKRLPANLQATPELSPVMVAAGGRIFIDATGAFRIARIRQGILGVLSHVYEAMAEAARTLTDRPEFKLGRSSAPRMAGGALRILGPVMGRVPLVLLVQSPEKNAAQFTRALTELVEESRARIRAAGAPAQRIRQSTVELNAVFWRVRRYLPRIFAGVLAQRLLQRSARGAWADGVRDDVALLSRGLPGNVTTLMDLAVGDLTDIVRRGPALAELLRTRPWSEARGQLDSVPGGSELQTALEAFLQRYGNRGAGEIDISRPRWRDDPSLLISAIIGAAANPEVGTHRRHHQSQVELGEAAARRLIEAAGRGPLGFLRQRRVARLTRVARFGMGLREHPKFFLVNLLGLIRAEVLDAARTLIERGQLAGPDQLWHLSFEEVARALEDPSLKLEQTAAERQLEFRRDQARKPPLAISSDGEIPAPGARKDLPAGALAGTAASAGIVEGIARVVLDPQREVLQAGEILVAPFTDPGWTPLFVHASGLVTEVGGLMTHGAVVAREYGIPAVVSVPSAVERIKTGQRIRVNGTRGFVEILEGA